MLEKHKAACVAAVIRKYHLWLWLKAVALGDYWADVESG